ncbi:MAG: glucose 1-dehydrogenase [Gemmatimonadales bacterium]|nr:glucose 1-dehydrogenase [Gemmatimonadales bacterium]
MNDFNGKRALVTGATSGIGRATARLLLERGATVLGTARREAALQETASDLGAGDRWRPQGGDLTSADFRASLIAATEETGGLDLLVNAAGILTTGTWETTGLDDWDRMLDINLRSVFDLTRRAIPQLKESRGAIVNVSSVTGTRAFPGVLAYCVSKAGVDQLTRCLALELAPDGVRVNAVNPGVVRTELHRAGGMEEAAYMAFLERSKTTHPLGRVGQPEEVAELIAFLGSSRAGWITGETIAIDGGRAQTCNR